MSGPIWAMSGRRFAGSGFEDLSDFVRLALGDNELQRVAKRNTPSLAAQSAELSHVIDVHDGVPVDALKLRLSETTLEGAQRQRGQQALPGCYDPHQFAFGLKRQDFIGI